MINKHENKCQQVKGRVSRFGACASDDVSAVKLIVFGPIRSEYITPAGYGGQERESLITRSHKIKLTGQCNVNYHTKLFPNKFLKTVSCRRRKC